MIEIKREYLKSDIKGISVRLPEDFHNALKAEAAKRGITKDKLFLQALVEGCKHI